MTGNQEAEVCHKNDPSTLFPYRGQSSLTGAQADLSASTLINHHEFGIGRDLMVRAAASPTVTIKIDLVAV